MPEKMTKMQACGALCELQEKILDERSAAVKWQKEKATNLIDPVEQAWRNKRDSDHLKQYDRWLRAIEMAGVALTR